MTPTPCMSMRRIDNDGEDGDDDIAFLQYYHDCEN